VTSVKTLFSAAEIARRVETLAGEIAATIHGDLTIVGILKGSFVFVADLARALDRAGLSPRIEFVRLSSYGKGKESTGAVRLIGAAPVLSLPLP
jgi:hypoxanthine phosphoribosyltransferase